ncbi:TetR/AcrR family transcriptional regulator [Phytoactinopolyspora limicola]|uniref:TetR/AcrR family transcriptional regulator n=1 Tax=Phytoactinopolyspora limicola TaxID=2715536 RepID=UPI00140B9104|nr:TetR/AcrR family transcriptional regulator [Phytoactinopolyspora limicola]
MGRPRSFDDADVLDAAMHVFRRHGYTGASVARLEEATGLTVGSLYNAFGDKAGLFRAAFAHYVQAFARQRLDHWLGEEATLDDLEAYLLALFDLPLNDGFGCLITNAAVEMRPDETFLTGAVWPALAERTERIDDVLLREVGPDHAREAGARLALMTEGLLLLARARRLNHDHRTAIVAEFSRLRELRDSPQHNRRRHHHPAE